MSRIRRIGYAISDKGRRASVNNQAARIRESVLSLLEEVNQNTQASRRVTKKAAFTVVLRSLQSTRNLPFSLREHMALKELSQYINLAQTNKSNSLTVSHTDLLPISHPRSTRDHSLTAAALYKTKIRWIVDDSRITDDSARTILASALLSDVDSVEHTYYTTLLSALPQGTIPADALLAAIGDGNSPLARSLRAQLQRRDRKGRFAYMGGGIRALIRRGGRVFSLVGRTLMDAPDGKVLMELPDGRIAKVTPEKGEYVKAVLNPTKDGYSAKPVRVSVTDEVIDEADLEFVDSPDGWTKEGEYTWKNEDWTVTKDTEGNYTASKSEGGKIVEGKSWADILDGIDEIEQPTQEPVAKLPEQKQVSEKKPFEFEYPEGAFKLKVGQKYEPQGVGEDEDVPRDFTDDPAELAQKFDPRDLKQALEEAVIPQGENENAFGVGPLEFNDGTGLVEADAIYNALDEAGEDADLELARIYDKANGNNNNEQALLDSRKGPEQLDQSKPDIAEAFERVTKEGTPDVEPAAVEPAFEEEQRDLAPLPPLLEGLEENELARFMETKDHTPYLPKNKDIDMPERYNKLDPSPFNNWREVNADNPDPVLPEGFSDNPVFLAQNVSQDDLKKELRRAVEPGNEAPGYGAIKLQTEDGEDFVANIPGEAVRDALQLQGVDTDAELQKIADEGKQEEPKPEQVDEMIEAEKVEEAPDFAEKNREEIAQLMRDYGFPEDVIESVKKMNGAEIKDFFDHEKNIDNWTPEFRDRWDDWYYAWAVDLPSRAQKERWAAFGKRFAITQAAGDLPEADKVAELPSERKPGTATEDEGKLDVKAMLKEEEDLADKYEQEGDGMPRGDAQAIAEADMVRKYGKTALDALLELDPKEAARILEERERELNGELDATARTVEVRKVNVRPEIPQDFEVNALEEVPDGNEEYPAAANVEPAPAAGGGGDGPTPPGGGPGGKKPPIRITVKVKDILPGDITVGEHFVITEIGEKVPGTDRLKIKGYYPGHVEQDTKEWNEWREIPVIRGAEAPEKGDLPVLSKPKEKDFGRRKKNADGTWGFANPDDQARFDAAMAEYNVQLDAAKKRWVDPTEPANQPHRVVARAADLQPGDVTYDPKKGHFVIERIFNDEKTKPGKVSVEGYYPGHVTQRKEWNVDTPIEVVRNVEPPAKGDLPDFHRPVKEVNGKWFADKDKAKNAEHQKMLDEAAARWELPQDLPVINQKDNAAEPDKDIPNAVAIKKPGAPRQVAMPAFQGEFANIAREAGGDWAKFEQLLADKTVIFIDFETTGINDADGNEPWQVAAVKVQNGKVVDRINIAMNPGRSIKDAWAGKLNDEGKPNAVDLDGNPLSDEYLAKQISQEEGMKQIFDWAGPDGLFVAYNMAFDEEVARRMADKHGLDWNPAGLMDILPMQKDMFKNEEEKPDGNRLGAVADFLDVNLENWHAADADAQALVEIFAKLVDIGKKKGLGKDLFDVDARNDEYIKKLDVYNERFAKYQEELANYHAAKALQDGMAGKEVNADDVVKAATAKVQPENVNMGQVGNEAEPVVERPEVVVLDFTPNVDFPRGKMILKDRDWALDDKNTVLLPRDNARMRDILPGDFMQSQDGKIVWQVVAVRGGEEFGLKDGRIKIFRKNVEDGSISTYEHWHGTRLDGVRRPINPRDLDAPATVAPGEDAPVIANEKENVANIEEKSVPGDKVYRKSVDIGGFADGYIRISKTENGKYRVIVGIVDNNDEAIYAFDNEYRTYEGAVAEAEAVLKERADELVAERRQGMPEPAEARAKDVPVSRGDLPAGAESAPEIVEVENLPADIFGKVQIEDVGEDKPDYKTDAVVQNLDGDLIARQTTNHPNKSAAEKEGRDFVNRAVEANQNPEPIAEEKPKREKKPLTPGQIKKAEEEAAQERDNEWVEANAGALAPILPGDLKVDKDFLWNPFFRNYEEIKKVEYIGYLNRYRITVLNRINGKIETRPYEAETPIRNVRRLGIQDEEFEIVDRKGGTNRGAKRGVIKRAPLEERIIAKTGRPMGGRFEKEGFYEDANGVPINPGDVVIDPKKPELGRGVVKRREGAQVEEGKRAGGVGRNGVMYLDYVMVQWENENGRERRVNKDGVPYAFPGVKRKAANLVVQTSIDKPIDLPDIFQGGRAVPNIEPKEPASETKKSEEKINEDGKVEGNSLEEKKENAREMGRKAFERGANRIPANDIDFMQMPDPVKDQRDIMRAWLEGYDQANIDAPLPEEKSEEPIKADVQRVRPLVDRKLGKDKEEDLREQIEQAIADKDAIAFYYNGKLRTFVPNRIWTNPQNGNINVGGFEDNQMKNFTIQKMEFMPTDENGLVKDIPNAAPAQNKETPKAEGGELIPGNSPGPEALNKTNLLAEIKKMRLALPKARADVKRYDEENLQKAGKQLDKYMRNVKALDETGDKYLKADDYEMRKAIMYAERVNTPLGIELQKKLKQIHEDIKLKRDAEKIAREEARRKKAAEPFPNEIWPDVDDITNANVKALFQELESRLPETPGNYHVRDAKNALEKMIQDLEKGVDPLSLGKERLERVYSGFDNSPDAQHVEWAKKLKPIVQKITSEQKKREEGSRKANLESIDPVAKAEERINNQENIVDAPNLKNVFANDDVFQNNSFLQPYQEELKKFFASDKSLPLAVLSSQARQALGQYISSALRDEKAFVGATPAETDKNIREAASFVLALRTEELAYSPNRKDVNVAQALKNINPNKIFKYGRDNATSGSFVPLIIDGVDTGFIMKLNENGLNARSGNNFWLIDTKTGQKFIIKREVVAGRANAELWSAKLLNVLGVRGVSHVERHPQDEDVIFVTFGGDNLDLVETPTVYDKVRSKLKLDSAQTAARAKIADVIGMMIFDGAASNTDRHEENFLAAEVSENGVARNGNEDLQLIPIDHGYAHRLSQAAGGGQYDAETLITRAGYATSRKIYAELVKSIGGRATHHLVDLTIQQAIQELKRDNGGIDPAILNSVISELETLRGIQPDKWAKIMGARE